MIAHKIGLVGKPIKNVAILCQIPTLGSRLLNTNILSIHRLFNDNIDCPGLQEKIPVFIGRRWQLFYTDFGKNNFV
jgi:hypothetical protein